MNLMNILQFFKSNICLVRAVSLAIRVVAVTPFCPEHISSPSPSSRSAGAMNGDDEPTRRWRCLYPGCGEEFRTPKATKIHAGKRHKLEARLPVPYEEILVLDPAPRDVHIVARHERGRQYHDALYQLEGAEAPQAEPADEGNSEELEGSSDANMNVAMTQTEAARASATSIGPVTEVSVAVHAMLAQQVPGDIAIRNMRSQIESRMAQLAGQPFTARDRRVGWSAHDLTLSELEVRFKLNMSFFS